MRRSYLDDREEAPPLPAWVVGNEMRLRMEVGAASVSAVASSRVLPKTVLPGPVDHVCAL